jgi:HlyD family secretion protein
MGKSVNKHKTRILIVTIILLAAGLVGGGAVVLAGERNRTDAGSPLAPAAQGAPAQQTAPAAQAASGTASDPRTVTAKGQLVPVQHATLSLASGGIVAEIMMQEGQKVTAGQPILRLRNEQQQAALAGAEAALANAQAQLDTLRAGPRTEEVASAQAALDAAKARRARLTQASRPEDVTAVRAAVTAAQAALKRLNDGPDPNAKIAAAADLANAQATVKNAQAAYDKIKGQPDRGMYPQSLALEQATNALDAAEGRYDELMAPPTADKVTAAAAQIAQAQANLDKLLTPATAADIAEADAAVRQAQAQLDLLNAGARQQQIAAAQAAVAQAEASRQGAAAAVDDTVLRAPFAGTVTKLYARVGEQLGPGVPAADLGDLSAWQVETEDLSELDVVRVQPGQTMQITFDAIPGLTLQGTVDRIQPKGEKKLGDMTYTAIVRVANPDPRLLWNMTAVVTGN